MDSHRGRDYCRPFWIGIGAPRCPVIPETPSGRSASFGFVRSGLPQIFSSVTLSVGRIQTFAAVFSDGVRSFHREAETGVRAPVSYDEVIRELTAFKSCTGVFVNRRLRRFAEEAAARGWHQHDDLSVAAMAFDRKASGG